MLCHGRNGAARSTFPDLRRTPALHDQAVLDAIVLQGVLSQKGMASFRDYLKEGDTVALRAYLISVAEAALAQSQRAASQTTGR
jgi:mono/diheme cytochrome c family protein